MNEAVDLALFVGFDWNRALHIALPFLLVVPLRFIYAQRERIKAAARGAASLVVTVAASLCGPRFIRLFGHFFQRFFDADLVAEEGEPRFAVHHALAVLAAPCGISCIYLFWKYADIINLPKYIAAGATRGDKCYFVLVSMVVMGFLAVIEWDALFLERRDYQVLGPLPVPARIIFGAKAASVLAFLAIFAIDVNLVGQLAYPVMLMGEDKRYLPLFRNFFAHGTTMILASSFIFFLCMALQGLMINLLPYRSFKKVSPYVQGLLVFTLVASFLLYPEVSARLSAITVRDDAVFFLFPPVWFYGLYERLLGSTDPVFIALASIALRAFVICVTVCAVTYVLSYRRLQKTSIETQEGTETSSHRLTQILERLAAYTVLRNPRERATFGFVARTINRSRMHRLILAAFVAVGMSVVMNHIVSGFGPSGRDTLAPGGVTLSLIPLILTFFILTGIRGIFAYPSQLRANWVFRVAECSHWEPYLRGVRKAMVILGVVPLLVGMFPFYSMLWGWQMAVRHLLFVFVLALIFVEAQLFGFRKIPFTCSYAPGKVNFVFLFVIYAFAMLTYVYSMAWAEQALLKHPGQLVKFLLIAAVVLLVLRLWSTREGSEQSRVVFSEETEPAVRELGLLKG